MSTQADHDAAVFYHAGGEILPLITQMELIAYEKLIGSFRSGETDLVGPVAALEALFTLKEEIQSKMNAHKYKTSKGE